MIAKKRRGQPDRETYIQTDIYIERQRDRETERRMYRHISSAGPHWGPSDPSVGINAFQRWTPTLEINTNTKIAKCPRTTGRTDGRKYYTAI